MKRIIIVLAALIEFVPVFSQEYVDIPDENFLAALIEAGVDTNEDGKISYDEAKAVNIIKASSDGISDMTGIEAFINLDTLICFGNQLTSLDLSKNTALKVLKCGCEHPYCHLGNPLTSLDVSNNIALTTLWCDHNQLSSLDLSKNTALKYLSCSNNQLTDLLVSNATALTMLNCNGNLLTSLDLRDNTLISSNFYDGGYYCTGLSLENMPALGEVCVWDYFSADTNHCIQSETKPGSVLIDTTGSPNIYFTTACSENFVYIPDTAFFAALIESGADINEDGKISFVEAEDLETLVSYDGYHPWFGYTNCHEIVDFTGIEYFINLDTMICPAILADSINLSSNVNLKYLMCIGINLRYLDVSSCNNLRYLDCQESELESLDVSNNTLLEHLDCSDQYIPVLDVSKMLSLTYLNCHNNLLTNLDLRNNPELWFLWSQQNQLTSLDISNNSKLTDIMLGGNPNLGQVCVWVYPFPPTGVTIETEGCPNAFFTTECAIGIEEDQSGELLLFPNPTTSTFTLNLETPIQGELKIHNLNGQLIHRRPITSTLEQIDMNNYAKGIYFVTVRSDAWVRTEKVVRY